MSSSLAGYLVLNQLIAGLMKVNDNLNLANIVVLLLESDETSVGREIEGTCTNGITLYQGV